MSASQQVLQFPETARAIERVEQHAAPDWKDEALNAIWDCASSFGEFTSAEVWRRLELRGVDASTHEPRAMGAMMLRALKEGWIERTGRFQVSDRRIAHNRPMAVWRSKL